MIFQGGATNASGSASTPLPGRRLGTFDPVNAHSQAGEPPLCFVMEFNAAEREWRETQDRLQQTLEDIENSLRTVSPAGPVKREQRRASQEPDTRTD
jgi:hypothetical protein